MKNMYSSNSIAEPLVNGTIAVNGGPRKLPRIIYNDDNCTLRTVPQPHSIENLSYTLEYLKGTQVDCLVWLMCTQIAYSWPSRVMENYFELRAKGTPLAHGWDEDQDAISSLHQQGIDYLPPLIDKAHAQGLSFIGSFRLNDVHHKSHPSSVFTPDFWKQHQEYRLWGSTDAKSYYNAALDYSYAEVRDYYRNAIAEVVGEYDIDGIELDFTRSPYFFQPDEAWDKREVLTQWVRDIRDLLEETGLQCGKRFTLMLRIPSQDRILKGGGIDAQRWIEEKLAPIVIISEMENNCNQQLEPWLTWCREAGVALYPAVERGPAYLMAEYYSPLPPNPLITPHSGVIPLNSDEFADTQRAMAQNLLAQRPDGLAMFNFPCCLVEGDDIMHTDAVAFEHVTAVLGEMGALETLDGKSKLYTYYQDLPMYAEAGRPRRFHQTIPFSIRGEDVSRAKASVRFHQVAQRNPHAVGSFQQSPFVEPGTLKYYLNDEEIAEGKMVRRIIEAGRIRSGFTLPAHESVEILLEPGELLDGSNTLAFEMPNFPRETDPYIYIYELDVQLHFDDTARQSA